MTVRRQRLAAAALAVLTLLPLLSACGRSGGVTQTAAAQISPPIALPAGTFTDTTGKPYDLRARDSGVMTLLYFGYTNCPDVCPTTMADIGTALRSLPVSVSKDLQVVFITSDPARDTPSVLRSWLANFDSGLPRPFVGLRTSVAAVDAYAAKVGVPLEPPTTGKNGTVEVTHGAETLLFSAGTEAASYVWLPGTTSSQYAADIRTIRSRSGG